MTLNSKPTNNPAYPSHLFDPEAVAGAKLMLELQKKATSDNMSWSTVYDVAFYNHTRHSLSLAQLRLLDILKSSMRQLFENYLPGHWLRENGVTEEITKKDLATYHTRIYTFFVTNGQSELKEQ